MRDPHALITRWHRTGRLRLESSLRTVCAGLGGIIGTLVLLGYALDFEPAWRLAPGLPATHPNTALCVALLGFGQSLSLDTHRTWRTSARIAILIATTVLVLRLLAPVGTSLRDLLTPFGGVLAVQAVAGKGIAMGSNTAAALLAIAAAEILHWSGRPKASQAAAYGALGILLVATTGYLDRLPRFYGAMAPLTLIGILALAIAALFATPRQGFLRALITRSEPGRLARGLLGSSTGIVLGVGWLISRHIEPADGPALAYQTSAIIVWTWALVTLGTVRADRIDRRRQQAERGLARAASTDGLTGLLSRNKIDEIRRAWVRHPGSGRAAKLFIDLDRFRSINEAFGHNAGDSLLIEVGRRLTSVAGHHALGRLGGDEFAIFCTGLTADEAQRIGVTAADVLAQPFQVQGRTYRLTASIGIAHTDYASPMNLQEAADGAMYTAKQRGGNQAVAFLPSMHDANKARVELEQALREALKGDSALTLTFQPVIRLSDRSLLAVEALVRWTHPILGIISPDRLIQLAEATGLIIPLGLKLMGIAVRQAALWHDRYPDRCPVMNINFSPVQFTSGDVVADLARLVEQYALPPSGFCIEVTEGAFTDESAVQALQKARDLGFKVTMDDFGIGHSSLSRLARLPLVAVKLDRSFIVHATETASDAALLTAVVQMAHALKLEVVAEGVERQEQLNLVAECGCDAVQGFLFSPAVTPAALEMWFSREAAAFVMGKG